MPATEQPLRIAYAIQNVGGIDFHQMVGDAVPVRYSILGLQERGHEVRCIKHEGRSAIGLDDLTKLDQIQDLPVGVSGSSQFQFVESGVRRLQRMVGLPYFAFFDTLRFYEACLRSFPGFHLCHEHNGLFMGGAALAAQRLGLPYILTFSADPLLERDLVGHRLRGMHHLAASSEARYAYKAAKRIICVSEPARQHLIKNWRVDPDKIVVMPNGVDTNLFRPDYAGEQLRKRWDLNGRPVVGFLGAFHPWHGLDLLVQSFSSILADIPSAVLLLIGDGRARPVVEQTVRQCGVASNVKITGLLPQDEAAALLSVVDVAVLPYPKLPQELWFSPLKLYEYMSSGKAIVASRAGQIREVLEHNQTGLLVESGDIQGFTEAIKSLLQSPSLRSYLGQNARQQAVKHHSWHRYIDRLEAIYQSVL